MNPLDIIVLVLLMLGVLSGARAGFLGPVLGLGGAVGGFLLAVVLATVLRDALGQIEQPLRAIVTLMGLGAFVLGGEAIGAGIGATWSHNMRRSALRPFDALGGAVVGAAHVVLLVWLLAGVLAAGMAPGIAALARDSIAVRLVEDRLPPPLTVAGRVLALLDTTDLPPLFGGLEPLPAEPVDLPADAEARALAESGLASTARIAATGCGPGISVGSGFFVSSTHAVTNAHVVAGSSSTTVTLGGAVHEAIVVAYDPAADLALLHVPGAQAPALRLAPQVPGRGSTGVALGYPGGGDLTVTAAAVTAAHDITGPNIYGDGAHSRSVVELRAAIRQGNSGGPLVVEPGIVGGVIFGGSRLSPEVGYAIGSDEAAARLGPSIGSTQAVATGACL
ncbi:MAG TPA: MarP family serine protease [Candidatus Limnocylindrales bacterium]|nr:MarP family serine protease [Candidatus Limnocylindrales bacterium]